MKRLIMVFVLFLMAYALSQVIPENSIAGKQYTLAYGAGNMNDFRLDIVLQHTNERNVMGNEMTTVATDRQRYGYSVISSGDEGALFEVEYLEWTHETDDTLMQQRTDFSPLIGKKVSFLLSATGEASQFKGFDELPAVMIHDQQRELTERLYILDIRETFPGLPGNAVGLKDTWTVTREFEEPVGDDHVTVRTVYYYTVAGEKVIDGHECVMVDGKYDVRVSGTFAVNGLALDMNLEGEGVRSFAFSLTEGMILNGHSDLLVEGTAVNEEVGVTIHLKHDYRGNMTVKFD